MTELEDRLWLIVKRLESGVKNATQEQTIERLRKELSFASENIARLVNDLREVTGERNQLRKQNSDYIAIAEREGIDLGRKLDQARTDDGKFSTC